MHAYQSSVEQQEKSMMSKLLYQCIEHVQNSFFSIFVSIKLVLPTGKIQVYMVSGIWRLSFFICNYVKVSQCQERFRKISARKFTCTGFLVVNVKTYIFTGWEHFYSVGQSCIRWFVGLLNQSFLLLAIKDCEYNFI